MIRIYYEKNGFEAEVNNIDEAETLIAENFGYCDWDYLMIEEED